MNWVNRRGAKWPNDLPAEYCSVKSGSPDLGASSAILITLCRHIESLERRVAELEQRTKVYVVVASDADDEVFGYPEAAFSTPEAAEEYRKAEDAKTMAIMQTFELEVDNPTD